jgi:hypothetical protein
MLKGEQWIAPDASEMDITINNSQLQAVLSHMTKSDWELVNLIWEQIDELFPLMAEVHKRTSGLTLEKIEPVQVETPYGTFRGGYYPIKYDPFRSTKRTIGEQEERAEKLAEASFSPNGIYQPSATTGAKIQRTKFFDPINFNLDLLMNHVDEVIQYISHYEAIKQSFKVTHDDEIRRAIIDKVGENEYKQIRPWLNDIANEGRSSMSKEGFDPILRRLRFGTTMGVMGFKASTGLMQISGLSNTAAEIGAGYTARGLRTVVGSLGKVQRTKDMWNFVTERSKIMANRFKTMDRELLNAMKALEGKTGLLTAAQETSMKHIALIQTYMVDLPTWYGAYYKGIEEAKAKFDMKNFNTEAAYQKALEDHAIKRADWTVENVQGSGMMKDMPKIMRTQSEGYRVLTMFYTFFSKMWNMQRDLVRGARSNQYSVTTVAAKILFIYAIPVAYEMLLRGDFPDEDDDESWYEKYLTNLVLYPFQTVPVIRDIANAIGTEFDFNLSPVQAVMEKGLKGIRYGVDKGITDGDFTAFFSKGAVKLTGAYFGIPGVSQVWNTGEHLNEVITEGEDFTVREFLYGPEWD